jgi:hypothetical protein
MQITKELNLTAQEITTLTTKELRDIYFQRIEDWLIQPMEILSKQDHTGWALVELFYAVNRALRLLDAPASRGPALLDRALFLDGDFKEAIRVKEDSVEVNPVLLVEAARNEVKSAIGLKPTGISLEDFRNILVGKAKRIEETKDACFSTTNNPSD